MEKSTAKPATDLRNRIAAVLIEAAEFRGVYQLHNPDMRFLADAVIRELQTPQPCRNCGCPLVRDWTPDV